MTEALQEWLAEGRRVVYLSFRLALGEYVCTLTDLRDHRSYNARAETLARCVELALRKAKAKRSVELALQKAKAREAERREAQARG